MEGAKPAYARYRHMTSAPETERSNINFSAFCRERLPAASKKKPLSDGQELSDKRAARRLEANEGGREEEIGPEIANPEEGWSATETSLMLFFVSRPIP